MFQNSKLFEHWPDSHTVSDCQIRDAQMVVCADIPKSQSPQNLKCSWAQACWVRDAQPTRMFSFGILFPLRLVLHTVGTQLAFEGRHHSCYSRAGRDCCLLTVPQGHFPGVWPDFLCCTSTQGQGVMEELPSVMQSQYLSWPSPALCAPSVKSLLSRNPWLVALPLCLPPWAASPLNNNAGRFLLLLLNIFCHQLLLFFFF